MPVAISLQNAGLGGQLVTSGLGVPDPPFVQELPRNAKFWLGSNAPGSKYDATHESRRSAGLNFGRSGCGAFGSAGAATTGDGGTVGACVWSSPRSKIRFSVL